MYSLFSLGDSSSGYQTDHATLVTWNPAPTATYNQSASFVTFTAWLCTYFQGTVYYIYILSLEVTVWSLSELTCQWRLINVCCNVCSLFLSHCEKLSIVTIRAKGKMQLTYSGIRRHKVGCDIQESNCAFNLHSQAAYNFPPAFVLLSGVSCNGCRWSWLPCIPEACCLTG